MKYKIHQSYVLVINTCKKHKKTAYFSSKKHQITSVICLFRYLYLYLKHPKVFRNFNTLTPF